MAMTIPTIPDEESPLLGGQHVSATEEIAESEPGNGLKPNKIIPFPWAQFSIVLFLQLTEPLTSQVIYPVSFPIEAICRMITER